MPETFERTLKIVCLVLAIVLAVQVSRFALARDPLNGLKIPKLPSLTVPTNSPPGNSAARAETAPRPSAPSTNAPSANSPTIKAPTTNAPATNASRGTAAVAKLDPAHKPPSARPRRGPVEKPAALPPEIQARVDRIVESEILGPVIHPVPMGLLGIAGKVAILRATNGQTGLVQEGGELGGIKLLRIGTNRVLVETDGQKQELTLFNGLGGESLLPKTKENSQ